MKNTFGNSITVTLFGESHGDQIGCVLDGLAPGISVSMEEIQQALSLRRPQGAISTARQEPDPVSIVSGVFQGKTTGTPLCILIPNQKQHSGDYQALPYRPGHADFAAEMKYHGYQDVRGGGHFSGRITAPLVAAGAILRSALKKKGIGIGTHIHTLGGIRDREFDRLDEEIERVSQLPFALLDEGVKEKMEEVILAAKRDGDSVGGILETAVVGMPAGVGEPWFDSLESLLSHALFSIPAVKGVEFGLGFAFAEQRGSCANDAFCLKDGKISTETNHYGGINGGISNGMPLLFRSVIKPTPTVSCQQKTVDPQRGEEVTVSFGGRHDPCIVHRARIVVDSVVALVLADALTLRYGTGWLASEKTE